MRGCRSALNTMQIPFKFLEHGTADAFDSLNNLFSFCRKSIRYETAICIDYTYGRGYLGIDVLIGNNTDYDFGRFTYFRTN